MKAIMISIKPKWCAKIMNGEKTIEVRKNKALANAIQKLIDEYGYAEIYVYCTKSSLKVSGKYGYKKELVVNGNVVNGKVPFKFRCYKVEEIISAETIGVPMCFTHNLFEKDLCKKSCLTPYDFNDYLKGKIGYAIHIRNLEIFDRPKELSEFKFYKKFVSYDYTYTRKYIEYELHPLTKAPQNFCYVEVDYD